MVVTSISLLIYGIGTVASLAMTYGEGLRRNREWDFYRVAGLALCFLWPVLVPVFIASAFFLSPGRRKRRTGPVALRRETQG